MRPANSDFGAWANELQETIERVVDVVDDDRLREFLLDHVNWERAFYAGRTPDEALSETLAMLKRSPDIFATFLMRG